MRESRAGAARGASRSSSFTSSIGVGACRDIEQQPVAVDLDMCRAGPFDDFEPVANTPYVVGLAGDHLSRRLAGGRPELFALPLDPRQALDDGQADLLLVEALGAATRTRPMGG